MSRRFTGLDTRARGRLGEEDAVAHLEQRGYRVLERNWTCRGGEIDVVALDGEVLCFVEVKARASREFGAAVEAITATKRRRLAKAAALYLARHPQDRPCRFDVVAMDLEAGRWRVTLVQGAFEVP